MNEQTYNEHIELLIAFLISTDIGHEMKVKLIKSFVSRFAPEGLVRCKDCKFYDAGYEMGCALNHKRTSLDDYCSEAERREE